MIRPAIAVLLLLECGCVGPARHPPVDGRWLDPGARPGPPPAGASLERPLRVVVYSDTRGNRAAHRAVVASIRAAEPDLVIFTGDALSCRPVGHLPDFGVWTYIIPFWPQYMRGRPLFSLTSLIPFPAVLHEVLFSPFFPIRDRDGFNAFLEDTAPLRSIDRVPYLFAAGNHDLYHRFDREMVARLFGSPAGTGGRDPDALWFSFDQGPIRFLVLDTGSDIFGDLDPVRAGGPQLAWLEAKLTEAEALHLRTVVCLHIPPYSSAREDPLVPGVRKDVAEGILDRHSVDLVLCGHAHAYERIVRPGAGGREVTYLITGGGGAPFHHEAEIAIRDPGTRTFVEETLHFILLEIGPRAIRGRATPVRLSDDGGPPAPMDEFQIELPPFPAPSR